MNINNNYNHTINSVNTETKSITDHTKPLIETAKMKLNFSVDRILGNRIDMDDMEQQIAETKIYGDGYRYGNCHSNGSANGSDCCTTAGLKCDTILPQFFPMSYAAAAMATMINFNRPSVLRPMPMRYLNRSPTVPLSQNTDTNYILKYHYLHQSGQPYPNPNIQTSDYQSTSSYKPNSISPIDQTVSRPRSLTSNSRPNTSSVNENQSTLSALTSGIGSNNSKRKRSWSRAVFSQLQRKGLEIQFQIQKYITKPDRRKLAARLGLTDAQVKVWFQNRRMKWRHSRENRLNKLANGHSGGINGEPITLSPNIDHLSPAPDDDDDDELIETSSCSSGDDEIDVVTE